MNNIAAPMFRKTMNGYNKKDVNSYILSLSRKLEESNKYINELSAANSHMSARIAAMEADCSRLPALDKRVVELQNAMDALRAELDACKKMNEELCGKVEDAQQKAKAATDEYNDVYRNVGHILTMASNTADDILEKAGNEAHKMADTAAAAKDSVMKSLSESTKDFTEDISCYINKAIENCIEKINESVRANGISDIVTPSDKAVFSNDN